MKLEREILANAQTDRISFDNLFEMSQLLGAISQILCILNSDKRIVFTNQMMLNKFNIASEAVILGAKFGDVIKCENASKSLSGCGTTDSCKYCDVYKSIVDSQEKQIAVVCDCCVVVSDQNGYKQIDIELTTSPFQHNNQFYSIISIIDTSEAKRKKMLESTFFHDIINLASGLTWIFEILSTKSDTESSQKLMQMAEVTTKQLLDEIKSQQQLVCAEKNELVVKDEYVDVAILLEDVCTFMSAHRAGTGKTINFEPEDVEYFTITDTVLTFRVLVNMVKNALEASEVSEQVAVSLKKDEKDVIFVVNNISYMSKEIQLQLFKRSFSTKGASRGIGTYSMKLLGEKYLGGRVWFESNKVEGTTFYFAIPLREKFAEA